MAGSLIKRAAALVAGLLVAACASISPVPVQAPSRATLADFSIEGRFSLRHEEKNYSGRLSWRHQGMANEVLLSSPFGQGIAQLQTDATGAHLRTSDGKSASAVNTEALTREVLGYPLPLERLVDWVRARDSSDVARRDRLARPLELRHQDWRIDYDYDGDDPDALPSRIVAARVDGFELRLRIDEWNIPAEAKP